ncbi:MAG: pilus assembly protein PilM [Candidatus Eremiobacteraeota bacterium]|nr:pilus assembly protein PilM [Candidatus Eremiobacteraeota bacterium]
MIFGKRVEVGLDIGSYALHWAAYDSKTKKAEVWCKPLSLHGVIDVHAPGFGDRVASLLKECESSVKLWNRQVVVGVQGSHVVSGYLEFPPLKESELNMAVISSVSREIPFPVHTMDIVHLPVKSLTPGKTAVFYSAWPKEQRYLLENICRVSELKIKRVEVTGIGLTREVFQNHALKPDEFHFLINIGHEITHLLFVRGGYPYYLRDIAIGGKQMTEAVALRNSLSWLEAQNLKESSSLADLLTSLGSVLSEFGYEFRRTLEYFQRRFRTQKVGRIYLSGGGALVRDLPGWLESELELPVEIDGWDSFSPRSKTENSTLNKASLGLALSG